MSLENLKASVMTLILVALIVAALAIGLGAFQDDMETANACVTAYGNNASEFNSTDKTCCVSGSYCAGDNATGTSAAFNATNEGLQGIGNASSYLSTIGTLIGVAALIAIVVGAFMFVQR